MSTTRRGALLTSGAAILAAVVVLAGVQFAGSADDTHGTEVVLRTERLGEGIVVGTRVRADGVLVGSVTEIAPGGAGNQLVTLDLDRGQLDGIDDSMRVDYATSNLFGISEIQLHAGRGGNPLRSGTVVDLTGARAADAVDATMGSLLRGLSRVGDQTLVTRVVGVLDQLATDVRAFTPLLEAVMVTAQVAADNHTLPTSYQLQQYGEALGGVAPFAGATVEVIDSVYRIEVLRTQREQFDSSVNMVIEQLFPGLQTAMYAAQDHFEAFAAMAVPILSAVARTVPTPRKSSEELTALLADLRAAMPDTPAGPVLNVDVDLRIAPVPVVPLLGEGVPR
ncbi:MlaD family protein [Nocardia thailandica]